MKKRTVCPHGNVEFLLNNMSSKNYKYCVNYAIKYLDNVSIIELFVWITVMVFTKLVWYRYTIRLRNDKHRLIWIERGTFEWLDFWWRIFSKMVTSTHLLAKKSFRNDLISFFIFSNAIWSKKSVTGNIRADRFVLL